MKAWRLEAEKINKQRSLEAHLGVHVTTPKARRQKEIKASLPKLTGGSNWLLDGLLLRGGYITQGLPTEAYVPPTDGWAKRVMRMFAKSKRWFGK